ncbi:MAG: hypothetical protein ABSH50_11700 [Bryobacteraceae bacterium]|jgi:hypothetical protein
MRFTLWLALAASAAGLTGCAPTVAIHPLYTTPDLVSDPAIEGAWVSDEGAIFRVQKSGDGYDVIATPAANSTDVSTYNVHLVRLQGFEFVDVASKSDPEVGVAGHMFAKVRIQGDELYVAAINDAWLKNMVQTGHAPQSTAGEGQQMVLTAPTSELQKFIVLYAPDPAAWDDEEDSVLHRMPLQ